MRDLRDSIRARVSAANLSASEEAEIVEEIAQHLEDRYQELRAGGSSDAEAEAQLLRELAEHEDLGRKLQGVRQQSSPSMSGTRQDVVFALRTFVKQPTFALAAVLALGLGAGAATAVFSLLDAVVLRSLPYREAEQLVMVWDTKPAEDLQHEPVSPVTVLDYRGAPGVFEDVAVWWRPELNLTDDAGEPMRVSTVETSENLFDVLGVGAQVGRTFARDSTLHGDEAEVVISDRLWRSRFGARQDVLGSTIRLNGFAHTVIGVMPPGFHFPGRTDVWQRLSWQLANHSRYAHFMEAVARLPAGRDAAYATAALEQVAARLATEHAASNAGWRARAVPLRAELAGMFQPGLVALFGASGLLLLIACINVANLLLARASARAGEVAVRSAMGASRLRLVRQFLIESLVLGAAGTVIGLGVAVVSVRAFLAWSPIEVPRADEIGINGGVLLFCAGVALFTTMIFGLVPALRASRADLQEVLRDASRGAVGMRRAGRARAMLVTAEVALAVALLAGAGLLIRSLGALADEETGVNATTVVAVDLQLPESQYDWADAARFYGDLVRELRQQAQLTAVGAANFLPLETGWRIPYRAAGDERPHDALPMAQYFSVDEGYFNALGVRVLAGRAFEARDDADAPPVVVVNEAFAKQAWPGEPAVGKRVLALSQQVGPLGRRLGTEHEHEVIGVVANVKNTSLTADAEPALYHTVRQFPFYKMFVLVDGMGTQADVVARVKEQVRRLDPGLPLGEVRTMERVLARPTDASRFLMTLMSTFAGLALLLAAIGIYGMLSFMVAQRRREVGIRMALGARPTDVLRLVVSEGVTLGVAGAAIGIAISLYGTRFLSSLLYGVQPIDPLTFGIVTAAVLGITAVACAAPAIRAVRTNPVTTLRGD